VVEYGASIGAGSLARRQGYVCRCAYVLERMHAAEERRLGYCPRCELLRDITP
jgi:hypothetical protein